MSHLGAKVDTFRPMRANVFAGFVLGVLVSCPALALLGFSLREAWNRNFNMPFYDNNGFCWVLLGFCILGGAAILLVAAAFALHARSLIGLRVDLHENGLRVFKHRSLEDVTWGEVAIVQEMTTYERPPILTYPANLIMPKLASKSYVVYLKSGRQHDFDGDSIKAIHRFGRSLREYSARAAVPWEMVESHV